MNATVSGSVCFTCTSNMPTTPQRAYPFGGGCDGRLRGGTAVAASPLSRNRGAPDAPADDGGGKRDPEAGIGGSVLRLGDWRGGPVSLGRRLGGRRSGGDQ